MDSSYAMKVGTAILFFNSNTIPGNIFAFNSLELLKVKFLTGEQAGEQTPRGKQDPFPKPSKRSSIFHHSSVHHLSTTLEHRDIEL